MGYTSTESKARYNAKAYDRITIRQPKGWRDEVKQAADAEGKSLAGYIREAVDEKMAKNLA